MAEKNFNVRFQLKYDTLENWVTNNPVLKAGETALATIQTGNTEITNSVAPPQILTKVGDGHTAFNDLPYTTALAADVHTWAKKSKDNHIADLIDWGFASQSTINNITALIDRLQYYGDSTIEPTDESYFTVDSTGTCINGLSAIGKTSVSGTVVMPYKINNKIITQIVPQADIFGDMHNIFHGATNSVTNIIIPNSVSIIGTMAFSLSTITSVNIPDGVEEIETCVFMNSGITSIKIPDSVTTIKSNAFAGTSSLKEVIIPDSVNNLYDSFSGSGIEEIKISKNLGTIAGMCFRSCSRLKTVDIPYGVLAIGGFAFAGCTSLTKISIPSTVTNIADEAFSKTTDTSTINPPIIEGITIYCEQGSYADTYAKRKSINVVYTEVNSLVGQKNSLGGEIFNDYTNNIAEAPYSHAEGYKTKAENHLGYKITDWGSLTTKIYTLTSVEGFAIDDIISLTYIDNTDGSSAGIELNFSKITAIDATNKTITVSNYIAKHQNLDGIISVLTKPTVGDTRTILTSHAEGYKTTASAEGSHSEGYMTTAEGAASHVEGELNTSSGEASHAEGAFTKATGMYSHSEGGSTVAGQHSAHAEGYATKAMGQHSHTEGRNTTATKPQQHVQGRYNIEDITENGYAHIVGNGTSSIRSNAHTLDWDGNAWFAGDVSVGGTYNSTTGKYDNVIHKLSEKANKATTLEGYGITDAYDKDTIDAKISSIYRYKGTVTSTSALPTENLSVGDVYNIETSGTIGSGETAIKINAGDNVAWTGTSWDVLAGTVDLSIYYTKTEVDTKVKNDLTNSIVNDLVSTNTDKSLSALQGKTLKEAVDKKLDAYEIITSITNNTLLLNDRSDNQLTNTTINTLTLTTPDSLDRGYQCSLSFKTGLGKPSIIYSATPIKWCGVDCDKNGDFTPQASTNYEVSIKCLGLDSSNNPIVIARVGVF